MTTHSQPACIPATHGKPLLRRRPLLPPLRATALGRLFKVLANDTRLRLLHALVREEELCVTDLSAQLEMAPQALSNQLQRLADRDIVIARREGTRVLYRISDPCVSGLLDLGICLLEEAGETSLSITRKPRRRR